jgi:CubicO group peptidase (beta-lactamase class C family)
MLTAANWTARLNELATRARVPGAALCIWSDGQEILVAHGVLNSATGIPVSTDSAVLASGERTGPGVVSNT